MRRPKDPEFLKLLRALEKIVARAYKIKSNQVLAHYDGEKIEITINK
jgi:hypothetical protein